MEKQLKEIEIPFGAKDSELCGWEYSIPEGMEATIVDNKIVVKKKDSGDEGIRKALLNEFIHLQSKGYKFAGLEGEEIVAWLEKQGKNPNNVYDKELSEILGCVIRRYINDPNISYTEREKVSREIIPYEERLEKQSEQKTVDKIAKEVCKDKTSAVAFLKSTGIMNEKGELAEQYRQDKQNPNDNVKPKFHEGDWIVYNRNDSSREILYVYDIRDGRYYFNDNIHFSWSVKECDEKCHLWTIEDVKDGDVLHSTGFHSDCIFIFNGLDNWEFDEPNGDRAVATGYCCLTLLDDNMEFSIQGPDCIEVNTVKPATKEQHDLLFQKMYEASYEWDAEKKELKKIEQSPSWSEEDENRFRNLIYLVEHSDEGKGTKEGFVKFIYRLKSLKSKNAWKPSKEQIIALRWILNNIPYCKHKEEISGLLDQINELREE